MSALNANKKLQIDNKLFTNEWLHDLKNWVKVLIRKSPGSQCFHEMSAHYSNNTNHMINFTWPWWLEILSRFVSCNTLFLLLNGWCIKKWLLHIIYVCSFVCVQFYYFFPLVFWCINSLKSDNILFSLLDLSS